MDVDGIDRGPESEREEFVLASTEKIQEVLACLNEGTTVHCLLSLFKDSAELAGYVVRAALDRHREETGKRLSNNLMRKRSKDLLPRYGIRIVINPDNHRWMVVLYAPSRTPIDFGAEVDRLVEEIRVQFDLGQNEASTVFILDLLRRRLGALRKTLGRLDS